MIRTEADLEKCRELWELISPGESAWDDWDLMVAFHDLDTHRFHFLVHEDDNGNPDGLVPLVHDPALDRYTLMGGSYPDGRVLWLRNDDFAEFFEAIPERTALFDLKQRWLAGVLLHHPQFEANVAETDMRYYLVPAEFGYDFHNHIDGFEREKRQKFLYDLRNINKREPVLRWSEDNEADL